MSKEDPTYEIKCIEQALIADRNLKLLVSILVLIAGTWLLRYVIQDFAWVWAILAIVAIYSGCILLSDVIKNWQPQRTKLIQLLQKEPEEIVWVYSIVTQKIPLGIQFSTKATMYFWLMEKDCITIKLSEQDVKMVSLYLNNKLPHASFGFSKEKEQWYMANPALLIRD